MAGAHTPGARLPTPAPAYILGTAATRLRCPGTTRPARYAGLRERVRRLRRGAGRRGCAANYFSLLHLAWYGQDWAELNHGIDNGPHCSPATRMPPGLQRPTSGSSTSASRTAGPGAPHRRAPVLGLRPAHPGRGRVRRSRHRPDWGLLREPDVLLPGERLGPDRRLGRARTRRPRGSSTPCGRSRFWRRARYRALRLLVGPALRHALREPGATYAEVYAPSFWQVPGPTPQYNHNTRARIDQLERQIRVFHRQTC